MVYAFGEVGRTRNITGIFYRTRTHEGSTRASGLPEAEFASRINNHINQRSINAEFVNRNLGGNCIYTLPHFCPPVTHLNATVVFKMDDGFRYFFETVTEPAIFKSESEPHCFSSRYCRIILRFNFV